MRSAAAAIALAVVLAPQTGLAVEDRVRLLDLSADVLPRGESQWGLLYAYYGRGITDDLQLSTHIAMDAVTLVNLTAKYRFLNRPELRASVELGIYWFAGGSFAEGGANFFYAPLTTHATIPLAENLELDLAGTYNALLLNARETTLSVLALQAEPTLVLYDAKGSWILIGRVPLMRTQLVAAEVLGSRLSGTLTQDDVESWGVMLARDHIFGQSGHIRFGLGYRNRPGIVLLQSFGRILATFDIYWR
jgi:hypothetical protein